MYHFPNTPSVTASLPLFREFSVTFPVEQIPNSLKDRSGLTISWPSFPIASSSIPVSQSILLPTWHYHHSFHDPLYKLLFHPLPNPVASCKLLCILQNTAKCNFLSNSIFFPHSQQPSSLIPTLSSHNNWYIELWYLFQFLPFLRSEVVLSLSF